MQALLLKIGKKVVMKRLQHRNHFLRHKTESSKISLTNSEIFALVYLEKQKDLTFKIWTVKLQVVVFLVWYEKTGSSKTIQVEIQVMNIYLRLKIYLKALIGC